MLACILEQAGLSYVIENDVVKVTTTKKTKGRLFTKVFSVADLVTPVPNFALPDYANFDKMLNKTPLNSGNVASCKALTPGSGGSTPYSPTGGLTVAGKPLARTGRPSPGIQTPQSAPAAACKPTRWPASSNMVNGNNTKHEQLIKLITGMVRPYSWDGHGRSGQGRVLRHRQRAWS